MLPPVRECFKIKGQRLYGPCDPQAVPVTLRRQVCKYATVNDNTKLVAIPALAITYDADGANTTTDFNVGEPWHVANKENVVTPKERCPTSRKWSSSLTYRKQHAKVVVVVSATAIQREQRQREAKKDVEEDVEWRAKVMLAYKPKVVNVKLQE
jgi:hypothetical protein